jgi:uncharacterized membrane protein YhhN
MGPCSLAVFGLWAATALAQVAAINGQTEGTVTGPSAAGIASAKVDVRNTGTGFTRTLASNESGFFRCPLLPLGRYTVSIAAPGFAPYEQRDIVLTAGAATTVQVAAAGPVAEPSRTDIGSPLTNTPVENLPLVSRNPFNFVLLQPNVAGHPKTEFGVPRKINANGLNGRINYQLDGSNNTESGRAGIRLLPFSDTFVQEVAMVNNGFAPESGNTAGTIFNTITKSGTNELHGEGACRFRRTGFSARPALLAYSKPTPATDADTVYGNVWQCGRQDRQGQALLLRGGEAREARAAQRGECGPGGARRARAARDLRSHERHGAEYYRDGGHAGEHAAPSTAAAVRHPAAVLTRRGAKGGTWASRADRGGRPTLRGRVSRGTLPEMITAGEPPLLRPTLLASLACSTVKIAANFAGKFPGLWLVTALSTFLLAVSARRHRWLAIGLLLGSAGDGLLAFGRGFFVHGLVAFLFGHVAYIVYFMRNGSRRPPVAGVVALAGYGLAAFWYLQPTLGAMQVPVLLYMTAIVLMAVLSLRIGSWAAAGALLFLLSDTVLAIGRFRGPLPLGGHIVWVTYYTGQYLLARSPYRTAGLTAGLTHRVAGAVQS